MPTAIKCAILIKDMEQHGTSSILIMPYTKEASVMQKNNDYETLKLEGGYVMSVHELYQLVESFYGYKCKMRGMDTEKKRCLVFYMTRFGYHATLMTDMEGLELV